jgi:tetratricopeptide (TPR) repeat protein
LRGFGDGLDLGAVLQRVLSMTPDAFDRHFDGWLRARFAKALAAIDSSDGRHPPTGPYITLVEEGRRLLAGGQPDSGRQLLRRAQEIFPDDGSEDGPAWQLARAARDAGDLRAAITQVTTIAMHNETARVADSVEADLRLRLADSTGALDALDREQWIGPYNVSLHLRIANLSESVGDMGRAARERRAVVALGPSDPLEARYQLARVLLRAGDRAAARREILRVLEAAPAFEKAQALLVQIQGGPT